MVVITPANQYFGGLLVIMLVVSNAYIATT